MQVTCACSRHDRDYLSYLSRAEELTAVRLCHRAAKIA